MKKKKISLGLIATGERTVQFYQEQISLIYDNNQLLNDCSTLTTIGVDFTTINQYLPDQFTYLEPLWLKKRDLFKEDVDVLIIPNITLHETVDRLTEKKHFPIRTKIIHPLDAAVKILHKENINTVVIIGSAYTSHCNWIISYFSLRDIAVIRMSDEHTKQVDLIRQRTYKKIETHQDHQDYNHLIHHYQRQAPVIIACTELSILLDKKNSNDVYDMARIQIHTAIHAVLQINHYQ